MKIPCCGGQCPTRRMVPGSEMELVAAHEGEDVFLQIQWRTATTLHPMHVTLTPATRRKLARFLMTGLEGPA